jgi:hypothetical protein
MRLTPNPQLVFKHEPPKERRYVRSEYSAVVGGGRPIYMTGMPSYSA